MKSTVYLFFFVLSLCCSHTLFAVDKYWTGATSTNWSTASNWSPSGAPAASDYVYINNNSTNNLVIAAGTSVTVVSINLSYKTLTINSGGALYLRGDAGGTDYAYLDESTNATVINNGILAIESPSGGPVGGYILVEASAQLTNYGTIRVSTIRAYALQNFGNITNQPCGQILFVGGATGPGPFVNNGYLNTGYIGGNSTNNGVIKYDSGAPSISNSGSVRVNDNPTNSTIFTYTGTFAGTINGIYTNAAATTSAGTFVAPNTFTPSGLSPGSQTLYAKITPSGGACSYVVPFTYVVTCNNIYTVNNTNNSGAGSLRQAMLDIAATTCPGPFTITATASGTINLASVLPDIVDDVTFIGPGASSLTVRRSSGGSYRIVNIPNTNTVSFNGFTIADGFADQDNGGGILNNGILTLSNCIIRNNRATYDAGGVRNMNSLTVNNCRFEGNTAASFGGGITNYGSLLSVTNSAFLNNTVGNGGGIFSNSATATVTNCFFAGNSAALGGGISTEANMTVTNCTFSGNTATDDTRGGGGANVSAGSTSFVNSTFSLNKSNRGGGIALKLGATATLKNCVIADNTNSNGTADNDLVNDGTISASTYNLIGTGGSGGLTNGVNNNIVGANALLAPLSDYGGTTQTHALLPGSPAINAGTSSGAPTTDQRGISRVGTTDIGSFESRGFSMVSTSGNNQSTTVSTAFANSLAVSVSSANSEPVAGGVVTFTGPASGASINPASVTASIAGTTATRSVTANATSGSYNVTASANGATPNQTFALTNTAAAPTISGFAAVDNLVCVGLPLTFTATVGNVTGSYAYTITNGSSTTTGTTSNTNFSQNLTPSVASTQAFTLTVTDNSQSTRATTNVTVSPAVVATLTANFGGTLTCAQTSLTLTSSGGTSYTFARQGGGGIYAVSGVQNPPVEADGFAYINASGVYSVTVNNTNTGCSSTASTTIYSNTATITVTNPTTTAGIVNTPFSQTFTASGGVAPRSFSLAGGSLPAGLSLNATTGVLSGTPTQSGSSSITVRATDTNGCTGTSATYTLVINAPTPTLAGLTATPNPVCVGSPITFTATVGNVSGTYNYTLTNGSSTSLVSSASSTTFSQTLTAAGSGSQSFTLTVSANGQTASQTANITVTNSPDYQPLADLYNNTGGANWTNKTGWLSGCDPCTGNGGQPWFGLTCANGRVSGISLFNNNLVGSLPASISALTGLARIQINGNSQLGGSIPTGLGNLTALLSIELDGNALTGSIPASLSALTNLRTLTLNNNQLTGSIPTGLGALTNLITLRLFSNQLTGSIPTSLSALTNLSLLNVSANQLMGDIPNSLSALTTLGALNLSNNQLTGSIPASLSALTSLQGLNLNNNQLTGGIPASLSALTNLQTLTLNNNQLTGSIPAGLGALTSLQILALNNNQLSGCLPASLTALCGGGRNINFANNPGLPRGGDFQAFCSSGFGSDGFVAQASASPTPVCIGQAVSLSANGGSGYSYNWRAPAGATLSSNSTQGVSATLTTSGVKTFTVVVSSGSSCSSTATVNVTGNDAPLAGLTNNGPLSCTLNSVTLTATGGDSYTFANGSGTVLAGSGNTRSVAVAGTYSVTVANASGCVSTTSTTVISATGTVTVSNPATSSGTLTSGFSQSFVASGGTGSYSYSLASGSLPAGLLLNTTTGVLSGTPTVSGSFSITVRATDANGCAGTSATYTLVIIDPTPTVAGLAASPAVVCVGSPVTFTATVGNVSGAYNYTLTSGSSTTTGSSNATTFSQVLVASGSGEQSATLTVVANGRSASSATSLQVSSLPVARLVSSGALSCAITSVTLTASGGTSYTFANGGGIVGTPGSASAVEVSTPGTYSVTVANASGCVSTTTTTVISVTGTVTVSNPTTTTATQGVAFSQSFIGSGGTGSYSYSLASGSLPAGLSLNSSTGVLSGTATASGSFSITVRAVDGNGCGGTGATYTLVITDPTPTVAGLSASPAVVCVGSPVSFTASVGNVSGSYSYTLSNGSNPLTGSASGNFDQTVTASGSGSQSFTLTVAANGQRVSTTTNLTVNSLPIASLVSSGTLTCSVTSVTLTASGGTSYTFTNGGGVVGTPGSASAVEVSTPGTYSVTVANASGCVSTTTTTVISATGTVTVSNPTTTTATQGVAFSQSFVASGGTSSYSYSLASGSLPAGLLLNTTTGVLSGTPTVSGSFSITVRAVDGNGCAGTGATYTLVIIDPTPTVAALAASPSPVCVGSPVTFTATVGNVSGAYNYTLTSGSSTTTGSSNAITFSQVLVASGSGEQSATLTVVANGRSASSATSLQVSSLPVARLVSSGALSCAIMSVTLTASGGTSYTFTNGGGVVGTPGSASAVVVSTPGTYSVTVANASGCRSTTFVTVDQNTQLPNATLVNNGPLSCTMTSVTLTAGGGTTYLFGNGATPLGANLARVTSAGVYSVTVIAANGCTNVASTTVTGSSQPPTSPTLVASARTTINQPISVSALGCNGSLDWTVLGGSGTANGSIYTLTNPGNYTVSAQCSLNGCTSSSTSLTLSIQASGELQLIEPGYDCQTGALTFRTQGGDGTTIEFFAIGVTGWTTDPNQFVDDEILTSADLIPIRLIARQSGREVTYDFDWRAKCPLVSDLTPTLYVRPFPLYGQSEISLVVDVVELNRVATNGLITIKITRDAKVSLSLPASATSVGGRAVQNSVWQLNTADPTYYVLTTNQVIGAGDRLSVGLTGIVSPGATEGVLSISSVLVGIPGEQKLTNNADAEKVEYFPR